MILDVAAKKKEMDGLSRQPATPRWQTGGEPRNRSDAPSAGIWETPVGRFPPPLVFHLALARGRKAGASFTDTPRRCGSEAPRHQNEYIFTPRLHAHS